MMYVALVRSRIDYACFLYSNAANDHLVKLNRIQYKAIRIITGNHRFTILENLEAEANIMPLSLRRKLLALNYFGKVYRLPTHPVKILYEEFYHFQFYDIRPHTLPIIGRARALANNLNLPLESIETINPVDLYTPVDINVKLNLLKNKKSCSSFQFQQAY